MKLEQFLSECETLDEQVISVSMYPTANDAINAGLERDRQICERFPLLVKMLREIIEATHGDKGIRLGLHVLNAEDINEIAERVLAENSQPIR